MALQKLQVNLDERLIREVDAYADLLHVNRTAAVAVLLTRALQADTITRDLSRFMDAYEAEKAAQGGELLAK